MTKEQELRLDKNRKKFDIREEYFVRYSFSLFVISAQHLLLEMKRLSAAPDEDWEPKRIARPKGLPEWGVPPTEPPAKTS